MTNQPDQSRAFQTASQYEDQTDTQAVTANENDHSNDVNNLSYDELAKLAQDLSDDDQTDNPMALFHDETAATSQAHVKRTDAPQDNQVASTMASQVDTAHTNQDDKSLANQQTNHKVNQLDNQRAKDTDHRDNSLANQQTNQLEKQNNNQRDKPLANQQDNQNANQLINHAKQSAVGTTSLAKQAIQQPTQQFQTTTHKANQEAKQTAGQHDTQHSTALLEQTVRMLTLQAMLEQDQATWQKRIEQQKADHQKQFRNSALYTPTRADIEAELAETMQRIEQYEANGVAIKQLDVEQLAEQYIKEDESQTLKWYFEQLHQPDATEVVVEAAKREAYLWGDELLDHYNQLAAELINQHDETPYTKAGLIAILLTMAEKQWARSHAGQRDAHDNPYTQLLSTTQMLVQLRHQRH